MRPNPRGISRLRALLLRTEQLLERLTAVPGVRHAGATSALPFHAHAITARGQLRLHDAAARTAEEQPRVFTTVVSPGYFETMQIRLASGRQFTARDRADGIPVAIINEALARVFFPDGDAVGSRVTIGVMGAPVEREIVGVVGSTRAAGFDAEPQPSCSCHMRNTAPAP
jgi:hypothetical protein